MRPRRIRVRKPYKEQRHFPPELIGWSRENGPRRGIQAWKAPVKSILYEIDRNFSASEQVRILFDPREVIIQDTGIKRVVPQTRFIARSFRHAGILSLTIPLESRRQREISETIRFILELGEEEKVNQIHTALSSSSVGFILERIPTEELCSSLLPSRYKHYTDQSGLKGILSDGIITASRKKKRKKDGYYVSLSKLSLSPPEVAEVLFSREEMEKVPGRGQYVIAFDLKEGSPIVVEHHRSDRSLEGWVEGNVPLDELDVTYAGQNHLRF